MLLRAIEVDPNCASAHDVYGNLLTAMGRHREAGRQFELAVDLDPLSYLIIGNAALCAHRAREFTKAAEYFEREIGLNPQLPMAREEGLAVLAREEARATKNIWLVALAMAYAQVGATDLALTRLEEAYGARDFWMVWLEVQPEFDPLRAEPRFQRLLRKVHLE